MSREPGAIQSDTFTVTTPNATPTQALALSNQNAVINTSWSYTFAAGTFVDYNNQTLTYTATGLPPGVTFNGSTRTFSGTPTTLGTYTITVTASDGTLSTSGSFNVSVNNAGNQPPIVSNPLQDQYTTTSTSFSYQFPTNSFTDPEGQTLTYTATQSSGSALPGWLSFNASTRTFSGTTPSTIRQYTIRVKATDPQGNFVTCDFLIDIESGSGGQFAMFGGDGEITTDGASSLVLPANTVAQHWGVTAVTTPYAFNTANTGGSGTRNAQLSWFSYDGENRTVITNGTLSGTQILTTGGYEQLYDAAGNAVVRVTVNGANTLIQRSTYTLRGQLATQLSTQTLGQAVPTAVVMRSTYDAAGRLLENRRYLGANTYEQYVDQEGQLMSCDVSGWLTEADVYTYDADGRLLTQTTKSRVPGQTSTTYVNGTVMIDNWVLLVSPDSPNGTQQMTDLSVLTYTQATVDYTQSGSTRGYDAAGRVQGYTYSQDATDNSPAFTWSYTYTYQGRDAWLEDTIGGTGTGNYKATTSVSTYDAYGRRTAVTETTKIKDAPDLINVRYFANDVSSGILSRRDGFMDSGVWKQAKEVSTHLADPVTQFIDQNTWDNVYTKAQREAVVALSKDQRFAYSNGQVIASVNQAGGALDARSRLTAYSTTETGDATVTVQDGDTLDGIAQRVYGNGSLWYVLAAANAIESDSQLVVGTQLKVPSVTVNKNDATTFRPYNPGQVIGPTEPNLPYIPPPPETHCGALSTLIGLVVRAIVTYVVGGVNPYLGYYVGAVAGNLATQYSSDMLNGRYDWSRFFSHNFNPFSGDKADYFRSQYDPAGNGAPGADYNSALIDGVVSVVGYSIKNPYVRAAATYTANTVLRKWAGEDVHWNNKSLVASVAATAISNAITKDSGKTGSAVAGGAIGTSASATPPAFSWTNVAMQTVQNVGRSAIQYAIQRVIGDKSAHWNTPMILADAFGNALGNNIVGGLQSIRSGGTFTEPPPIMTHDQLMAWNQPSNSSAFDPATMPGYFGLGNGNPGIDLTVAPEGGWQTGAVVSRTVQRGDSLIKMAGTADPATIGMLVDQNNLTGSMIRVGQTINVPQLSDFSPEAIAQFQAIGEAVLAQDNARLELIAAQRAQQAEAAQLAAAANGEPTSMGSRVLADGTVIIGAANPYGSSSVAAPVRNPDVVMVPHHAPSVLENLANGVGRGVYRNDVIDAATSDGSLISSISRNTVDKIEAGLSAASSVKDVLGYVANTTKPIGAFATPLSSHPIFFDSPAGSTPLFPGGKIVLEEAQAGRAYTFVLDASKIKVPETLKFGARWAPWAGLALEGATMNRQDPLDVAHLGTGVAVTVGTGFLASVAAGPAAVIGVLWAGSDIAVQHYEYQGQTGWRALGHSYNDQMTKVYQNDPNFYRGPKY